MYVHTTYITRHCVTEEKNSAPVNRICMYILVQEHGLYNLWSTGSSTSTDNACTNDAYFAYVRSIYNKFFLSH